MRHVNSTCPTTTATELRQGVRKTTMTVIHYDSGIQAQIETLVRGITDGRGYVRKGKTAVRASSFATLRMDSVSGRSNQGIRRRRSGLAKLADDPINDQMRALDELDTALLDSQTLCERAAHQVLRDGDCKEYLDMLKQCFQNILQICTKETAKRLEEKHREDELQPVTKQMCTSVETFGSPAEALEPGIAPHSLEVDDGEDVDDSLCLMPYERFAGMSRMTAC